LGKTAKEKKNAQRDAEERKRGQVGAICLVLPRALLALYDKNLWLSHFSHYLAFSGRRERAPKFDLLAAGPKLQAPTIQASTLGFHFGMQPAGSVLLNHIPQPG
jgi:hypothetical protein